MSGGTGVDLAPGIAACAGYEPARHPAPCDLDLAGTAASGIGIDAVFASVLADAPSLAAHYPGAGTLAATLAAGTGVTPAQVLVTAGADEALDRTCRAFLAAGRSAIITDPTFEMIPRYVAMTGAAARAVRWPCGPLPVDAIIAAADDTTSLVVIATPNNPTGTVAAVDDIRAIHDALPRSIMLVDLAYVEFAREDPSAALLQLPRVVTARTLSKAWGIPGLRVGYSVGAADSIAAMRRAGSPYSVSSLSLALAERALECTPSGALASLVARTRLRRDELGAVLRALDADVPTSEANFVCVAGPRARWLHDALGGLGIRTRLLDADISRVRITVPLDDAPTRRLHDAIRTALAPEALLFDLDGVLADVSMSYREAIRLTAQSFGVTVTPQDIRAQKAAGNANDDWQLTATLINARGVRASLADVTERFEALYQGSSRARGLHEAERLLVPRAWLVGLATRYPLAVVTGRPRADAERFLNRFGIRDTFRAVIAREDGPLKPDPAPVRAALHHLGVRRAWLVGDTPDDIASARAAGVVPIGILAAGGADTGDAHTGDAHTGDAHTGALLRAGAARVLNFLTDLDQCLN